MDIKKILDKAEAYIKSESDPYFKEQVQELIRLEDFKELNDRFMHEFKKKELVWSDEVKKTKLQEIRAKRIMIRQGVDQANRLLTEQERELLLPLQKKVVEIVDRIGKEEGYAMIFELGNGGIWYAPDSLNLTGRIVQELNEFYAREKGTQ